MNTYKKTTLMFGMMLAIIPQICKALDQEGMDIDRHLTSVFYPDPKTDFLKDPIPWQSAIVNKLGNYILKNSRGDSLLNISLNELFVINKQLGDIVRELSLKNKNMATYKPILEKMEQVLIAMRNKIYNEKYYITSKQNAKEMLLNGEEYMSWAVSYVKAQI